MKEETKNKTLSYRRALFFGESDEIKPLEHYLIDAHTKLIDISQRAIKIPQDSIIQCRNYKHDSTVGVFLHLAAYSPGEQASIVPSVSGVAVGEIKTTPPPSGSEFMDGDIMALVVNNHVLLCTSNLHEKNTERYMIGIIEAAGLDSVATKFGLSKVGDINKMKVLQKQGVKAVHLDISLFDATVDHLERKSVISKICGGAMDQLMAFVAKDLSSEEIVKAENLSAHIVLKYDSRVTGKTFGKDTLTKLAHQILDEDDDGFMIETLGGEKIRANQIAVRKTVSLPKHGKSVYRQDAWNALATYYSEIKAGGLLEQ